MKNSLLKFSIIALVLVSTYSCKDKTNETNEAGEVAEATDGAVSFTVDTAASEIMWTGKKPLGAHNGNLKLSSGEFFTNNNAIESGKFVIDMTSITVKDLEGDEKASLEGHLKGSAEGKEDHFFDVKNNPTGTFEITEATGQDGNMMIKGNLTVKGKTNEVLFNANVTMADDSLTLKSEPFMIDRTKWGVNYGSKSVFDDLGDKFINDEMEIVVNIVAKK